MKLTVQELYDLAKDFEALDFQILIQYRDDGGDYSGKDEDLYTEFDEQEKTLTL
jgi:hypothetical protein